MSCASASLCIASGWQEETYGDGYGIAPVYEGGRWHAPHKLRGPGGNDGVSCTAGSCLLLNGSEVLEYSGDAWNHALLNLPLERALSPAELEMEEDVGAATMAGTSIACAAANFCLLAGQGAHNKMLALTHVANQWGPFRVLGDQAHTAISCATAAFCAVAMGRWKAPSEAILYEDGAWRAPTVLAGPAHDFDSVSCPSTSFCVAVDTVGDAALYNGSVWSAPAKVAPSVGLSSVSCASPSFCVAVGTDGSGGVAVTFDGASWSAPVKVSEEVPLEAVSCPTASFCVAGGAFGQGTHGGALFMYPSTATPPLGSQEKAAFHVTPLRPRPGTSVRISGVVGRTNGELDCLRGDRIAVYSAAFAERAFAVVSASGSFAKSVTVPRGLRPGSYAVHARCIAASLGTSVRLRVIG